VCRCRPCLVSGSLLVRRRLSLDPCGKHRLIWGERGRGRCCEEVKDNRPGPGGGR